MFYILFFNTQLFLQAILFEETIVLKLNGNHQLLVNANDVNVLGGSIHSKKEKTESLAVAGKKIGLGVNADKTKYMVLSLDQNAGQSHTVQTVNSSFERVDEFRYLGTILTNQNTFRKKLMVD